MARLVFANLRRRPPTRAGLRRGAGGGGVCGGLAAFAARSRARLAADLRAFGQPAGARARTATASKWQASSGC
jgi:hypothetical protein